MIIKLLMESLVVTLKTYFSNIYDIWLPFPVNGTSDQGPNWYCMGSVDIGTCFLLIVIVIDLSIVTVIVICTGM